MRLKGGVGTSWSPEIAECCCWLGSRRLTSAVSQSPPWSPYTPSIYVEEDNPEAKEARQDHTVGWWWK